MKPCIDCHEVKPLVEYREYRPGHWVSFCRPCDRMRRKRSEMKRRKGRPPRPMGPKVRVTYVREADGSLRRVEKGAA